MRLWGGGPAQFLEKYGEGIRRVHLKDTDGGRREEACRQHLDFCEAVRQGVFVRSRGLVNFVNILGKLRDCGFTGWMIVEQDVLAGGAGAVNPFLNAVTGREFLRPLGY